MAPLLLLLFLPFALCCETIPNEECKKLNFVPGHNLVGEGFDIVRMKTTGAFVVDVLTYMDGGGHGNCTVCDNSLLNEKQKVPASVTDWRVKVECRHSLSTKVYESASSVLKETSNSLSLGWKVGLSVPLVASTAVAGTLSVSARFANTHSAQDKYSFTGHTFSCRYYTFRLQASPPMTKEFAGSISSLPAKYDSKSEDAYNHFISIYGTHFLRGVDLGGHVKSTTAVKTCQISMSGLTVHDVSICLSREASVVIEGVNVSAQAEFCAARQKKLEKKSSFSGSFTDRVTEILGGNGEQQDILFNPSVNNGYGVWLKSLKKIPGVVSYSLSSLHMLVNNDPVRKASLQAAISKYITKNAISTACPSSCKVGQRDRNCACKCNGHQKVDNNCCPSQPGVATLKVTVKSAEGLWGDRFSKTDGYVKVFYGTQKATTPVIKNNNFPQWNYLFDVGTVDLNQKKELKFEVWDRDNRFDDDLLGRESFIPQQGNNVPKKLTLKHGSVLIFYTAKCGPSLTGSYCEKYAPTPGGDGILNHYQPFGREQPMVFKKSNGFTRNVSFL
ncbi:perforin-1.3 [Rhinichthys klamathensis goyatoka]|uniref:perforin-1.3 n=1 Tax=Rhinichthys klamathensis goyatoka TaxID=3034132 RepID=UPI0024B48E63|nr:perforin-1.3 [Rhinichthys klamathensis goyatoka]